MNKKFESIHKQLTNWGKSKQQHLTDETIKNTVLNNFSVNSQTENTETSHPNKPSRAWWLPMAVVGASAFVLVFVVMQKNAPSKLAITEPSPSTSSSIDNYSTSNSADSGVRMDKAAPDSATGFVSSFLDSSSESKVLREPEPSTLPYQSSPPSGGNEIPATDNRQFLKTDYNASVRSRTPQELTNRIQTMVRGYEGRIDNASSSPKYGSITFVIPVSKLDAFRSELAQLAGSRFVIEQTSSQNLLGQKQVIEQNQADAKAHITEVTTKKDQLTAEHNKTIGSIQAELDANTKKQNSLQYQWNKYPEQRVQLESQIKQAQQEKANLNNKLSAENNNYQTQLNSLNSQQESLEKTLASADKEDGKLLDNVATVRGSIVITKMNIWQFLNSYMPDYWFIYLLILGAIIVLIFRNKQTKWMV